MIKILTLDCLGHVLFLLPRFNLNTSGRMHKKVATKEFRWKDDHVVGIKLDESTKVFCDQLIINPPKQGTFLNLLYSR